MENETDTHLADSSSGARKFYVIILFAAVFVVAMFLVRKYLDLEYLAQQESSLKQLLENYPVLVMGGAFVIYVAVTGLSLPGALAMSLTYAWFFGFTRALILISFASTAGATIAFLFSRYLLRDAVRGRFSKQLRKFDESLEREGPFYLFTLRLVPAVPFFVVNAIAGLTNMRVATFWWVSQVGMFAGTCVFVYAGSRIPDLQTLHQEGAKAVFTSGQITQITIALTLLGVFPITVKKLVEYFRKKSDDP